MKLLLVFCGLACVAVVDAVTDDIREACHHAEALDVITGDNADCPAADREALAKKAFACRCGYATPDGSACTDALKNCLCSDRTMDSTGDALFTGDYTVAQCPPKPTDCPAVRECVVTDFYNVLTEPKGITATFQALLDKLPQTLKNKLEYHATGLEFLAQKVDGKEIYLNMNRTHFVRALGAIRELTRFTKDVRHFFRDENGCLPCEFPKCFMGQGLSMLPKCAENADGVLEEEPFSLLDIFNLASGTRHMCPNCVPKPAVTHCPKPEECGPNEAPLADLETGCLNCHLPKPTLCPKTTLVTLEVCAENTYPEKQDNGCPSCKPAPVCDDFSPQIDLAVCDAGETPRKDGCYWTCRLPTFQEMEEACGSEEAMEECDAMYDSLRECGDDEDPEWDWNHCCDSCKRKPDPTIGPDANGVCTTEKEELCRLQQPSCALWQEPVFCTTDEDNESPACKQQLEFCCAPCSDPTTVIDPIDNAECMVDLPLCAVGEEPQIDDWSECISCRKGNPCEVADCAHGCHIENNADTNYQYEAVCDEAKGVIEFDLFAAVELIRQIIQMPLPIIREFAISIMKRFCESSRSHPERQEQCKDTGMRVINSVQATVLQLVDAGVITDFGSGMTAAMALLAAPDSSDGLAKIHIALQFSVGYTGGRRLLAENTAEGVFVKESLGDAAASGGVSIEPTGSEVVSGVPPTTATDGDPSTGVSAAPSFALVVALVLMLFKQW